jgi:hypothetical protein
MAVTFVHMYAMVTWAGCLYCGMFIKDFKMLTGFENFP